MGTMSVAHYVYSKTRLIIKWNRFVFGRKPLDKQKLKLQYSMLLSAIKMAIDEWNPYDLLPCAPSDEFDGEIMMIAAKIKVDDPVDTIAEIVSNIFSRQFGHQGFHVENCQGVAAKIRLNIDSLCLK